MSAPTTLDPALSVSSPERWESDRTVDNPAVRWFAPGELTFTNYETGRVTTIRAVR